MPSPGWLDRKRFSLDMQKVAISKYYHNVWPGYQITEIDELSDDLAVQIDIGGGDKLLRGQGGHIIFLGQRFGKAERWHKNYRDFTIREAEYHRHLTAIQNGGFIPGYYVLGYANRDENDFLALYIIDYRLWLKGILSGEIKMQFKKPRRHGQECFYYFPLEKIPERYLIFKHHVNGHYKGPLL